MVRMHAQYMQAIKLDHKYAKPAFLFEIFHVHKVSLSCPKATRKTLNSTDGKPGSKTVSIE